MMEGPCGGAAWALWPVGPLPGGATAHLERGRVERPLQALPARDGPQVQLLGLAHAALGWYDCMRTTAVMALSTAWAVARAM